MSEKYWVGDLCYVIEDWDGFCDATIQGDECLTGDFTLSDGVKVSVQGTAHGDGEYLDQYGNVYPVDAGLIGVIKLSDVTKESGIVFGHVHEFENIPSTVYDDGLIGIGHVVIETDYDEGLDEDGPWQFII